MVSPCPTIVSGPDNSINISEKQSPQRPASADMYRLIASDFEEART